MNRRRLVTAASLAVALAALAAITQRGPWLNDKPLTKDGPPLNWSWPR